ncbi:MAG: hypothetical protein QM677_05625 [Microbacterium sp.]
MSETHEPAGQSGPARQNEGIPAAPPMPALPSGASDVSKPPTAPASAPSPQVTEEGSPGQLIDELPAAPGLQAPFEDVLLVDSVPLPGGHRGGFSRELTEPVPITTTAHDEVGWAEAAPIVSPPMPRSAPWALVFGILGLTASFLVGWAFLIGVVGAVLAIAALRRPWESRAVAVWALCLSVQSLVYSAGWLWWASTQGPLFG